MSLNLDLDFTSTFSKMKHCDLATVANRYILAVATSRKARDRKHIALAPLSLLPNLV